jgi:hypothetical protein
MSLYKLRVLKRTGAEGTMVTSFRIDTGGALSKQRVVKVQIRVAHTVPRETPLPTKMTTMEYCTETGTIFNIGPKMTLNQRNMIQSN